MENTNKILGTNGRGPFVPSGSDNCGSDRYLMLCQESNFKLEQEIPKMENMNSNVIDIPIDKKKNGARNGGINMNCQRM